MPRIETPVSAAIRGTIEGTFGLAGKVVEATGNAVRGVGEAVGGAMQGALSPAPITVINGVGMAGQAAQAKVSGSGTIPASPKKSARPTVNPNMPTEKLLVVAVNYLSSIEKTLEQQLQFERRAFQQQAQAEKEAAIETGGRSIQNPFSNLGEKLGAVKDNAKERAGTLGKLLIGGGLLGALGLAAIGNLDTSQLDELKSNWAAFTDKISPIIGFVENFANAMGTTALAGAAAGFMFGGPRGALAGLIGGKIYEDAYGTFNPETGQREGGKGLLSSIVGNFPLAALAIAPVTAVKFAYRGVKVAAGAVTGFVARQAARFTAWFTEKAFIRFAFSAYGKNRLWNLFLRYLEKKAQQRLLAQIAAVGAAAATATAAEAAIAATGVGVPVAAVSAVVTKLIAAGFAAWLLWDLYQIWVEFSETAEAKAQEATDEERANATPARSSTSTPSDASAVAGSPVTSSQPISTTSATSGQNKTITGVVDGGRGYTTVTYSDGTTERRGGTLPARTNNPGNIMDGPIARSYGSVGSSPSTNGPDVAVFPTREMGFAAMDGLLRSNYSNGPIGQTIEDWATDPTHPAKVIGTAGVDPSKRYTDFTKDEKVRFMQALAKVEGFYAAGSGPTMKSASTLGSIGSSLVDMGKGTLEFVSNVLRAGLGENRPTSGSQLSGFNDNMQGNIGAIAASTPSTGNAPAVAAPIQGESATAAQLARTSAQIQNAVDLGNANAAATEIQQESTGAASIRQANSSNDGKLECLDPNFPGRGAIEGYLQYHRLAA
jgi:hypothetical protein